MTNTASRTGYASVNGLEMYYEIHGSGRPLVLLHGGLSGIETSFGLLLPTLAETRQVVAVELQAHGRTADIDRPLTIQHLADDTVALLEQVGVGRADVFGYSLGSAVALQVALDRPDLVRKLVAASLTYTADGLHPGMLEGMAELKPEHLAGTPFEEEYARIAPDPEHWPTLIEKMKALDAKLKDWSPEQIRGLEPPTLLIIGDSDIVRPEHAVEMFRLLGGGVLGDVVGLPKPQLAVLPGTTHITLVHQADVLLSIIPRFLDAPTPDEERAGSGA